MAARRARRAGRPARRGFTLLEVILAAAAAAVGLSLWGQLAREATLREGAAFEGAVLAAHGATAGNLAASDAALRGRMADPANPLRGTGFRPYSLLETLLECFQNPTVAAPGAWEPGDAVATGGTPGEMPPEVTEEAVPATSPVTYRHYEAADFPPGGDVWRTRWRDEFAGLLNEARGGDVYRRAALRAPLRRDSTTGGADNIWRALSMSCVYFNEILEYTGGTTPPAPRNFVEDNFKIEHSIRKGATDGPSTFDLGTSAAADYVPGSTHCVDAAWVSPAGESLGPGSAARPDQNTNILDDAGNILGPPASTETYAHYLRIDPDTCMGARLMADAVDGVHWRGGIGSAESRPEFFVGFADPRAAVDAARAVLSPPRDPLDPTRFLDAIDVVRRDPSYFRLTGVVVVPGYRGSAPGGRADARSELVALAAGPGAVVFDADSSGNAVPRLPGRAGAFSRQYFPRPTTGPGLGGAALVQPGDIGLFSHLQETDAINAWIGTVVRNASAVREEARYSEWRVFDRSVHHQPETVDCDAASHAEGRCNRYGPFDASPPYASLTTRDDEAPDLTNDHGSFLLPETERSDWPQIGGAWADQMRELVTMPRQELTGNLYATVNPTSADSPAGARVVWADFNVWQHGRGDPAHHRAVDGLTFPVLRGPNCTGPTAPEVDTPYAGPCRADRVAPWRRGRFVDTGLRSAWSSNGPLLQGDSRINASSGAVARDTILDETRLSGVDRLRGGADHDALSRRRAIHGRALGEGGAAPRGDNDCKSPFVNYWRPGWRFDGGDSFPGGDRSGLPTRLRDRRFHNREGTESRPGDMDPNTEGRTAGAADPGEYLELVDLDRLIPPHAMFQNVFSGFRTPAGRERIDSGSGLRTCSTQHLYFIGERRGQLISEYPFAADRLSLLEGNLRANDRFGVIRSRGNLVLGFDPVPDGHLPGMALQPAMDDGQLHSAVKDPHERVWPRFLNVGSVGEPIRRLVVRGNLRVPQVRVSGQADLVIGRSLRAGVECSFIDSDGRHENGMLLPTIGVAKRTPYTVATYRSNGDRLGLGPLIDEVARYRPRCLNERDFNATRPSRLPHGQRDLPGFPGSGRVVRNANLISADPDRTTVILGGGTRYREHLYADVHAAVPSGYAYRETGQLQGEALARLPLRGLELDAGEDELPIQAVRLDTATQEARGGTSIVRPRTPSIYAKTVFSDAATRVPLEVDASNFDPATFNAPFVVSDGPAGFGLPAVTAGTRHPTSAVPDTFPSFTPPRASSGVGNLLYQCLEVGETDEGRATAAGDPAYGGALPATAAPRAALVSDSAGCLGGPPRRPRSTRARVAPGAAGASRCWRRWAPRRPASC